MVEPSYHVDPFSGVSSGAPDRRFDRQVKSLRQMLRAHFAAKEQKLLAQSAVAAGAGHPVHKGAPREAFVREFLEEHLAHQIAIGQGEIIDGSSEPGEKRPDIDIVLYRSDYPRLTIGGNVSAFLAESVIATIEVKSSLTSDELEHAITTAVWIKGRPRSVVPVMSAGYQAPGIACFVVAYDGPANMHTVKSWIAPIHQSLGIIEPPLGPTRAQRMSTAAPAVDGIFVLGKGYVVFDNSPINGVTDEMRVSQPNAKWLFRTRQTQVFGSCSSGSLWPRAECLSTFSIRNPI